MCKELPGEMRRAATTRQCKKSDGHVGATRAIPQQLAVSMKEALRPGARATGHQTQQHILSPKPKSTTRAHRWRFLPDAPPNHQKGTLGSVRTNHSCVLARITPTQRQAGCQKRAAGIEWSKRRSLFTSPFSKPLKQKP